MTPIAQATWPIIGQAELGRHISTALRQGTLPHAVLFSGPRSLGKATGALWVVQADLCQEKLHRPCGSCTSCRRVTDRQHPQVRIIDPSDEAAISVDDVRSVLGEYQSASWKNERRWLVLLDAERLTESAGNVLLKFLEHLPNQLRVICTSSDPDKLLSTVRSRLTQYYWHTASPAAYELSSSDRRRNNARLARSAGRPGWYYTLTLENDTLSRDHLRAKEVADQLRTGHPSSVVANSADRRQSTSAQLQFEELVLRDILLAALGATNRLLWPDLQHPSIPVEQLHTTLERYLDRHELSTNVQPRILYDDLHMV